MELTSAKLGVSRIAAAQCYLTTARVVHVNKHRLSDNESLAELPAALLVATALELFLKGYLLLRGQSEKVVRAYNHRLEDMVAQARTLGLQSVHRLEELAASLTDGYNGDFTYRYPTPGVILATPNWKNVEPIFDELIGEIAPLII